MPILIRLFTDLTVYREIVTGKLSATFLRFCLAYLLISLGLGVWINHQYSHQAYTFIDSLTNQILADIPDSASFSLYQGILSATATTSGSYLTIDSSINTSTLATSASFLTLGNTHFRLATDLNGTYEIRSYLEEGWLDSTISGQQIRTDVATIRQAGNTVKPYLPLLLTLPIFLFYLIARLTHTLFYALLLRIFGSSLNRAYRFTHYWQLTLHSVIVADTINLLILIVYHQNYPLIFSLAFFGITILAYLYLPVNPKPINSQPTK